VVVRARDRDDLADADRAERLLVGTLELRRVVDAADADDDALAGHETRDALDGADRARVGERDRRALEVATASLLPLTLRISSSYAARKPAKSMVSASRSTGRRACGCRRLRDVDGEAHVDVLVAHERGLPSVPVVNVLFMFGTVSAIARTIAQPMRCVKLTLPCPLRLR
jgi:hypothetical protein